MELGSTGSNSIFASIEITYSLNILFNRSQIMDLNKLRKLAGISKIDEVTVATVNKSMADGGMLEFIRNNLQSFEEIVKITNSLSIMSYENVYGFFRNQEVVGYVLSGRPIRINNENFTILEAIYFVEQIRKTKIAGVFILALEKIVDSPIIIGKDDKGGNLSLDGKALIKALEKRAEVRLINLKTGEKVPFDEIDTGEYSKGWSVAIWGRGSTVIREMRIFGSDDRTQAIFFSQNWQTEEEMFEAMNWIE